MIFADDILLPPTITTNKVVNKGADFKRAAGRKSYFEEKAQSPGPGDYNIATKVSHNNK